MIVVDVKKAHLKAPATREVGRAMFGLQEGGSLPQARGPSVSLKEEPLGAHLSARAWMQPTIVDHSG